MTKEAEIILARILAPRLLCVKETSRLRPKLDYLAYLKIITPELMNLLGVAFDRVMLEH